MKNYLILIFIIYSSFCIAQNDEIKEAFTFESKLNHVTNNDSISKYVKEISKINVANKNDTTSVFDKNSKWELLYLRESGWYENMPGKRQDVNELYIGKPNNVVFGEEIINSVAKINQTIVLLNETPNLLQFIARDSPLNRKYITILLENNIINLQYIHSYPNGNQSSWFHQTNYYFKKIQ